MLMKTRTEPVDDHQATLDDILSTWHHHCLGFKIVQSRAADPMFKQALRAKGGQTQDAIREDQEHEGKMRAMDFHVFDMQDPYRSAILILARNCYTGKNVWLSPRLPKEPMERGKIVGEARAMLIRRLKNAGVM